VHAGPEVADQDIGGQDIGGVLDRSHESRHRISGVVSPLVGTDARRRCRSGVASGEEVTHPDPELTDHLTGSRGTPPRPRAMALVALLVAAMIASTYQQSALAVLSGNLLAEFGMTRSQLGLTFTAASLVGAFTSPFVGVLADKSSRGVLGGLFVVAALGTLIAAEAPSYPFLLVATLFGGLAIGAANPVTNRIVSERISLGRRGLALGLKQSGPPMSTFLAGLILPGLALVLGWRLAMATGALLAITGLAATVVLTPTGRRLGSDRPKSTPLARDVRSAVRWLNAIGFGIAMGNGALLAFLPLYAQEGVGLSPTGAGLVASVLGVCGVAGRITWGTLGNRFHRPSTALIIIAGIAVLAALSIGISATVGAVTLWLGAVLAGASSQAWHAVAWLVILDRVGTNSVGKASGVMQTGSSIGFAIGPVAAGSLIDATGSYWAAWGPLAVLFAVVMGMTMWFRQQSARRRRMVEPGATGATLDE